MSEGKRLMELDSKNSHQVDGDHYSKLKIQPHTYITRNGLKWDEGNCVKYITRHEDKAGAKDVVKCIHYSCFILRDAYGTLHDSDINLIMAFIEGKVKDRRD